MNCTCQQCGRFWVARAGKAPARCPGCFTTAWNRDKKKAGRPRKPVPDQPALALGDVGPVVSVARPVTIELCVHGRVLGNHCWQCPNGVAKTPEPIKV